MTTVPNPRYPGSPARMADGRLFTDYRANCSLLAPLGAGRWADFDRKQAMVNTGAQMIGTDRALLAMRAGTSGCVDTMVPELSKRVYNWDGPAAQMLAHPAGLGTGRLYLPGRSDLVTGDPDVLAAATFPAALLPGTFSSNPQLYTTMKPYAPVATAVLPARPNRYSAPYG